MNALGVLRAGAEPSPQGQEAARWAPESAAEGFGPAEQGLVAPLHARHALCGAALPGAERT